MSVPREGSGRTVTRVALDGRPLALLIHDPSALRDPALVDGVRSALAVAVANVRLQAQIRARLRDVEASTRRLRDAAETQRRHLAAELRSQVQPSLDRAGRALAEAGRGPDLARPVAACAGSAGRAGGRPGSFRARAWRPAVGAARACRSRRVRGANGRAARALPARCGTLRVVRLLGGAGQRRQACRCVGGARSPCEPRAACCA